MWTGKNYVHETPWDHWNRLDTGKLSTSRTSDEGGGHSVIPVIDKDFQDDVFLLPHFREEISTHLESQSLIHAGRNTVLPNGHPFVWGFLSVYRDLFGSGLAFVPSDEFTREANEILRAFMYDARYAATPIDVPELAARLTTLNDLVGADEALPGLSVGGEGRERGDDDEEGGGDGEEEGSNRGSKRQRGASST